MSFFYLFLFVRPVREFSFYRFSLSLNLLYLPPLFRLNDTVASIFLQLMSGPYLRVDALIRMRRARCTCRSSSKKYEVFFRLLPQTKIRSRGLNFTLICNAFPVDSGGHCYA